MNTPLTKVTIVTEAILKDKIIELVRRHGATGYTMTKVEGEGSRGVHASDWEGRNVKLEVIIREESAAAITSELNATYFEDYSVIAWLSEVTVIRGAKFATDGD